VGDLTAAEVLAPLGGEAVTEPRALGLDRLLPDRVAGFAPFMRGGERYLLRLDLAAPLLARQRRTVGVLLVVVLGANGGVLLLVVLFLRYLMAPFEQLLERARQVGGGSEGGGTGGSDEVELLLSTFERAVAALVHQRRQGELARDDDIAAVGRALAPSLASGLLLLDREGAVLALNPVGAEMLEVAEPPVGTPLAAALAAHPPLVELLADAVARRAALRREQCEAGERTIGLTVHPLRRDDGGVRGFLVLFADLTEAERAASEERLEESLAQLGEMAAGVAHELRNGLATLTGYLTLIERHPGEESIADYLGEMRREADQLQRVLDDFLTFARPESVRREPVDLLAVARRAAADPALAGAPVTIASEGGAPRLAGDRQLLEQAVRNLLRNAVEAQRAAGCEEAVAVTVERLDDRLRLAVEDRGDGVAPQLRPRLFHPFATGRPGGVGLGLALTHRVATLHGGHVRLRDRPGGGTCAELLLPL
jgi:signal transduction histidine kinase